MTFYQFIVTVRHDRGSIRIRTMATSAEQARNAVMLAERCPERAILEVRAVDGGGLERRVDDPTLHLVLEPLSVLADAVQLPNPYRGGRGIKIPTRYWVQDGTRRRRVYLDNRTPDIVHYVERDGIRTAVLLPGDER